MSVPFDSTIIALKSNADLSAKEWLCVIGNGDDDIDVSGAGGIVIGVLTDNVFDGTTTAQWNSVQVSGLAKVAFGGTVAVGTSVKSDAAGKAVAATTDQDIAFGYAMETSASGDLGVVMLSRHTISI